MLRRPVLRLLAAGALVTAGCGGHRSRTVAPTVAPTTGDATASSPSSSTGAAPVPGSDPIPGTAAPAGGGPGPTPTTPADGPTAAPRAMVLGGTDLGVTKVGARDSDAVAAVSAALGQPDEVQASSVSCAHAANETRWGGFRLATTNGKVDGWWYQGPVDGKPQGGLATPSGLTVGATVARLKSVYGSRLHVSSAEGAPVFTVDGIDLGGDLQGAGDAAIAATLWNGSCGPP